jgi:hypothetical protein
VSGWLIGGLVDWLIGGLVDWLIGGLVDLELSMRPGQSPNR